MAHSGFLCFSQFLLSRSLIVWKVVNVPPDSKNITLWPSKTIFLRLRYNILAAAFWGSFRSVRSKLTRRSAPNETCADWALILLNMRAPQMYQRIRKVHHIWRNLLYHKVKLGQIWARHFGIEKFQSVRAGDVGQHVVCRSGWRWFKFGRRFRSRGCITQPRNTQVMTFTLVSCPFSRFIRLLLVSALNSVIGFLFPSQYFKVPSCNSANLYSFAFWISSSHFWPKMDQVISSTSHDIHFYLCPPWYRVPQLRGLSWKHQHSLRSTLGYPCHCLDLHGVPTTAFL